MKPSEFLVANGWRRIGDNKAKALPKTINSVIFWDHPEHQHDWGMFTTTDAVHHQKAFAKYGTCDCIRQEAE